MSVTHKHKLTNTHTHTHSHSVIHTLSFSPFCAAFVAVGLQMIVGLQAFCRGYLARRYHGALLHGSNAILVIQRNARAYMKLRSWPWWKLFTKIKPLLKVARGDEEMRLLREELDDVKQAKERGDAVRSELETRVETLEAEKKEMQQQLEADGAALADAEEVRTSLVTKNSAFLPNCWLF